MTSVAIRCRNGSCVAVARGPTHLASRVPTPVRSEKYTAVYSAERGDRLRALQRDVSDKLLSSDGAISLPRVDCSCSDLGVADDKDFVELQELRFANAFLHRDVSVEDLAEEAGIVERVAHLICHDVAVEILGGASQMVRRIRMKWSNGSLEASSSALRTSWAYAPCASALIGTTAHWRGLSHSGQRPLVCSIWEGGRERGREGGRR